MYWIELLRSMRMSSVVIITDGDSVLEKLEVPGYGETTPLEFLLDHQIMPIVRDGTDLFPNPFTNMECVSRAAALYQPYGMKPIWLYANEPFDGREWNERWLKHHPMPDANDPEDFAWVMGLCQERASRVIENGGIAGFPDGPCYPQNPFEHLDRNQWEAGLCAYASHCYGKNRPVDYPYDRVSRHGEPLTEAQYREALDDLWGDPDFQDHTLEEINDARWRLRNLSATAIQDDTCWRGWEKTIWYADQAGFPPISFCLTEGGWQPRDRAGTGEDADIRWPMTTPKMVGKHTLEAFGKGPFFAQCMWLLADDAMCPAGYVGWPYDAWVGWAWKDVVDQDTGELYGFEKPVVRMSQGHACGWASVRESVGNIIKVLDNR